MVFVHFPPAVGKDFTVKDDAFPQWDQEKGAGRNSSDQEEKGAVSGDKDRKSQGQVMKEERENVRLDREAFNLILFMTKVAHPDLRYPFQILWGPENTT